MFPQFMHLQSRLVPEEIVALCEIKNDMKVAECGCGQQGHFTFPLAHAVGAQGTVYAIDVDVQSLDAVRRESQRQGVRHVQCVHADIGHHKPLPLASYSCERALCVNRLHNFRNMRASLQHIFNLLCPKGIAVLIDWDPQYHSQLGPLMSTRTHPHSVAYLAAEFGGHVIDSFTPGIHWWGLKIQKH